MVFDPGGGGPSPPALRTRGRAGCGAPHRLSHDDGGREGEIPSGLRCSALGGVDLGSRDHGSRRFNRYESFVAFGRAARATTLMLAPSGIEIGSDKGRSSASLSSW